MTLPGKDDWIRDNEQIIERFRDGELSLEEIGELLIEQGFDPGEIRSMLDDETKYPIPKGYFGKEKEQSK